MSAMKGHIISGGIRATTLIEAGVAIVRTDADGDTYKELCTVSVTTGFTDCEATVALQSFSPVGTSTFRNCSLRF